MQLLIHQGHISSPWIENNLFQLYLYFFVGELYLALVTSTQAHAKLLKVDPTKALSMTGVVDFISHKDVPGHNTWGVIPEESFASTEVTMNGGSSCIRYLL